MIVKNIAQNILAFLKSNAAKEGHTYWLFKAKDDDIVKLYDLSSLSHKDSGINSKHFKRESSNNTTEEDNKQGEEENPFQTPVSMLLYRLARNILDAGDRDTEEGTVRELLNHCVSLLNSDKYPHIATSAHFLLSELYLPDGTDPAMPAFSEEDTTSSVESDEVTDDDDDVSQFNVDVSSLCKP